MGSSGSAAPATPAAAEPSRLRGSGRDEASPAAAPAPTLNQIRYPCLMNMEYHAAREAWLDQVHRWLMFAVIVAGAGAFVDALPAMRVIGPVVAVVAGALDLTFDLSNRARNHARFRERYGEIMSQARQQPERLAALQAKLDQLSGEEEPPFLVTLALCAERAQIAVYGDCDAPVSAGLWRRVTANLLHHSGAVVA